MYEYSFSFHITFQTLDEVTELGLSMGHVPFLMTIGWLHTLHGKHAGTECDPVIERRRMSFDLSQRRPAFWGQPSDTISNGWSHCDDFPALAVVSTERQSFRAKCEACLVMSCLINLINWISNQHWAL